MKKFLSDLWTGIKETSSDIGDRAPRVKKFFEKVNGYVPWMWWPTLLMLVFDIYYNVAQANAGGIGGYGVAIIIFIVLMMEIRQRKYWHDAAMSLNDFSKEIVFAIENEMPISLRKSSDGNYCLTIMHKAERPENKELH